MKTRILAFVALIMIAMAWHFFLVRHKSLAPSAQASDPDLTTDTRNPSSQGETRAPASPAPEARQTPQPAWGSTQARLTDLQNCLQTQNCDFPKTDPRSYELAVGQAAKSELVRLTEQVRLGGLQDESIREIALSALNWQDDHVREQALTLLATQKPSPTSLVALMAGLRASHDSSIYKMGLQELKRYQTTSEKNLVENFLVDTIENGSFYSSTTVASSVLPFLSDSNVRRFQELLTQLEPGTQRYRALQQSLREFERR